MPLALITAALKLRLSALVLLCAWLFATGAQGNDNDNEWPQGHYPLPERGNMVGERYVVSAEHEDTLVDIAREHNIGYEEIIRANPEVSIWLPGEGTEVVIPRRYILPEAERTGIVINIAELRLYYYPEVGDGETPRVETYPIGIGRDGYNTPLGVTQTTMRLEDPAWYPPESMRAEAKERGDPPPEVVPPGPENPLGEHAILLDIPGYLIHGTNEPDGIGMRASRGCIRMFPEDIESIFSQIPDGTRVNIIDAPIKLGWDERGAPHVQALDSLREQKQGMQILLEMVAGLHHKDDVTVSVDYQTLRQVLENSDGNIVPLS